MSEQLRKQQYYTHIKICVCIVIFLISCAIAAPLILTQPIISDIFNFANTGQIGDTIAGTSSPFIGLASIMIGFITYLLQLKLNREQKEQFEIQESRFNQQRIEEYNTEFKLAVIYLELTLSDVKFVNTDINNKYTSYITFQNSARLKNLPRAQLDVYKRALSNDRIKIFSSICTLAQDKYSNAVELLNRYFLKVAEYKAFFSDLYENLAKISENNSLETRRGAILSLLSIKITDLQQHKVNNTIIIKELQEFENLLITIIYNAKDSATFQSKHE